MGFPACPLISFSLLNTSIVSFNKVAAAFMCFVEDKFNEKESLPLLQERVLPL
jgi:hypothetical protein